MSTKQLMRLAVVLAGALLLWGAVALASKRGQDRPDRSNLIPKMDTATIDTIALVGPRDTAILVRNKTATKEAPQRWLVNGKPTDPQPVGDLLRGLADSEQSPELVARSPASHARLRVTADSGRKVRIVGRGRTMVDWIAGKQTVESDGIYLRQPSAPEVYVLRSELGTALARPADDWRNHTIAEVPGDSVGAIEITRGGKSYRVRRQGSAWVLGSGGQPDSSKITELLSSYRDVKASGFAGKVQLDSLQQAKPRRSTRLLDRQNKPLLSMVFDSMATAFWVRVDGSAYRGGAGEWYRLEPWTADQLTPPDSSLRKH